MRVGYHTKPYDKKMEVFQSFSGGLNTMSAPDTMQDSELTDILNMDIGERGSLKRRYGLKKIRSLAVSNKQQGYGRFYKTDGTYDELFALGGKLYRNSETTALTITGLTNNTFQDTKPIEMVQFGEKLYIATGTKLVQYDGTSAKVVTPYTPTTEEMTYVGTNALFDDPTGHLTDSTGLVASIDQAIPYGTGKTVQVQVFCTVISGESYQFSVQTKKASDTKDFPAPTSWGTRNASKVLAGKSNLAEGKYTVQISMRQTGTTEILSQMEIEYKVDLKPKTTATVSEIGKCTRLLVHWQRLCAYGNTDNPTTMYMSHINMPDYFPGLLNLEFDNPRREGITSILHYRNSLVVFTKTSTQALYGSGLDDFKRTMLHTDLGCIAPYGAAVMKNSIGFLSSQGVYTLKTMGLTDDKATVEKIDTKIANLVSLDTNVLAVFEGNQLQMTFPNSKKRLRFYPDLAAWTRDYSEKFDYTRQYEIDSQVFCLGPNALYAFDSSVYDDDDYNYTNQWESKYISFGQPYHKKKLKEVHVMTAPNNSVINSKVYIYADEQAVITPESGKAEIVDGAVVWTLTDENNFQVNAGTIFDFDLGESAFGDSKFGVNKLKLTGNCLRTRIRVENNEPTESQFIGFAYIFKVRRP